MLTLLMIMVLAVTNSAAIAHSVCRHHSAEAHAAARQSRDVQVAGQALSEETAAKAASQKGSLADNATNLLVGYIAPEKTIAPPRRAYGGTTGNFENSAEPASRSILPLLEPPLA